MQVVSSDAEDAREEDLEVIRRYRIWPEDAINGRIHKRWCLSPPFSRRAALPGDRQCITLLYIAYQQTTSPPKKKKDRTCDGYRNCCPRWVPIKEESLEDRIARINKPRRIEAIGGHVT